MTIGKVAWYLPRGVISLDDVYKERKKERERGFTVKTDCDICGNRQLMSCGWGGRVFSEVSFLRTPNGRSMKHYFCIFGSN